jgi:hypothetical protein
MQERVAARRRRRRRHRKPATAFHPLRFNLPMTTPLGLARVWISVSLFGLAQALRLQNKNPAEAADLAARFKRVWAQADVTLTSSCFCLPGT